MGATPAKQATASRAAEVVDHGGQRQVGEAVAVVGQEHLLALQEGLHGLEAHADVGVEAGVDEGDLPVLDVAGEQVDLACRPRS